METTKGWPQQDRVSSHDIIGRARMDPDELKTIRYRLCLTQEGLARELDVSLRTLTRWESGTTPISRVLVLALRHLVRIHRV